MDRAQHFAGPGLATADDCDDGEEVSRVRLRYPRHLMSGLDSRGIEIPLKPAGKGGVAQFPAGSPAQATACGQSAPVTEVAGEDYV